MTDERSVGAIVARIEQEAREWYDRAIDPTDMSIAYADGLSRAVEIIRETAIRYDLTVKSRYHVFVQLEGEEPGYRIDVMPDDEDGDIERGEFVAGLLDDALTAVAKLREVNDV